MKTVSLFLLLTVASCSTSFDQASVRPVAGASESVQVAPVNIPYNPQAKRFVVAVQPVTIAGPARIFIEQIHSANDRNFKGQEGRSVDVKGGREDPVKETTSTRSDTDWQSVSSSHRIDLSPRAIQMRSQLISALSGVGNFKVVSNEAIQQLGGGRYSAPISNGEVGPFVFKALITEYSAETESDRRKVNLLVFDRKIENVQGVVGIDIEIIDGRDGSVITAFPVHGTFSSRRLSGGVLGYSSSNFAQSLMDQALRVALNEAATEAARRLPNSVR